MTSQVNPNNIDGTYPVAGQDNDSQGFRDNFTNIRNNFTYIKAEIEDLQTKSVLKTALTNTTLDNDFAGNIIANPSLKSYREEIYTIASGSTATVDFARGNLQKIILSVPTTISFSFPSNTSGQYASIKLWVEVSNPANTLTLPSTVTLGDPDTIAGLSGTSPPIITFNSAEIANNNYFLFEFFTIDGGTTIGIRDLVRNRDVDLSGMAITGNLSLDGLSVSTHPVAITPNVSIAGNLLLGSSINSTVGSNVIVRSSVGSTSSTTGALVVLGGAGIAANLHIDGNILVNSGNIRGPATSNVFNFTSTTINFGNAATNIFMGASTGNVRIAGNVWHASNTITQAGRINSGYFYANVVTDQNLFANVLYNTFIANASPHGTVANLRFTLPAAAEDGREIVFRTLVPITVCFVSNGGETSTTGNTVQWIANTFATAGNVTARFIYNATSERWMNMGG